MPHVFVIRHWSAAAAERRATLKPIEDELARIEQGIDYREDRRAGINPYSHVPEWRAVWERFIAAEQQTWAAMVVAAEDDRREEDALREEARAAVLQAKAARRAAREVAP